MLNINGTHLLKKPPMYDEDETEAAGVAVVAVDPSATEETEAGVADGGGGIWGMTVEELLRGCHIMIFEVSFHFLTLSMPKKSKVPDLRS